MTKSLLELAPLAAVSSLLLSAYAEAPTTPSSSPASSAPTSSATGGAIAGSRGFKACMVSDFGGFDDKSFNETSYKGPLQAREQLGVETAQIESKEEPKCARNVQSMIDTKCGVIVTVGFTLASAMEAVAKQNPNVKFAIVDNESFEGVGNAKELISDTAQPAFMAGYVTVSLSQTGKADTFGGADCSTMRIFMDGLAQGVEYYSKAKGKSVQVLGWDRATKNGQFIDGASPFDNNAGGKSTTNTLITQGVDVILSVAGPSGLGTLAAVKETSDRVNAIWVGTNDYVSAPECRNVIVISIEKSVDVTVLDVTKAAKKDSFSPGPYIRTLKNKGVDLSELHDFNSRISVETRSELEQIRADIISGKITVEITVKQRVNNLKRDTLGYSFSGDHLQSGST